MNDEPTIGSPPIPTIVELPSPIWVSSWPIWYVSVPERETSPIEPSRKISAGMIPTLALPGESAPGQFGPSSVTPRGADVRVDAQHLVRGDALGDADHGADAGVDRLVDGVGGERAPARRSSPCSHPAPRRRRRRCRRPARPRRPGRPCPGSRRRRASSRRRGCAGRGSAPRSRSGPGRRAACRCRR